MIRIPGMIFLVVFLLAVPAGAQQSDEESSEPVEYGEEEFSSFLRDLRRAEIVTLGSFPITLFLTLEVFDIYRYIDHFDEEDRYRYTPWPYRSPEPASYSSREIAGILITAVSASVLIAAADYFIGRAKEKRSER